MTTRRLTAGLALVAALAAGCGAAARQDRPASALAGSRLATGDPAAGVLLGQLAASPRQHVPSALRGDPGLPAPIVPADRLQDGGPGPDGIPAIDHPRFVHPAAAGYLSDTEPVVAVEVAGQARAYPIQILIWHEIVNDTIAGVPVAVTYCPLCNSALTYDRRLNGQVLDFGVSGKLFESDQVMFDRQTESLWAQFLGESIAGALTGSQLRSYPTQTLPWKTWKQAHPDGWVLTRDTGFQRDYGANPYAGYDTAAGRPFLFNGRLDARLPPARRIVGLGSGASAVAVAWPSPPATRVLTVQVDGTPVSLWWQPGGRSPLDADSVTAGRDIGASGAFRPVLDGRPLSFVVRGDQIVDTQTHSHWSLAGRAESGPLAGRTLTEVPHVDSFWFAWVAFWPHTRLVV